MGNFRYRKLNQGIAKFLISVKKAAWLKAFVTKNADKIKKADKPPKPADKRVRVDGDKTGNTARRILEKNTSQDVTDMETSLDKAAKRSDADRTSIKLKFNNKFNSCFKVMMQNRYKGLCIRCSGVATSIYDSASGSYKFKRNFCANTIKECAPVYALMAESQKFYMQMVKLRLADENNAELRRLLMSNGSSLTRILSNGTDGPGYVKVDSSSSVDLNAVKSGDEDSGYDSSSALLKASVIAMLAVFMF